MKKLILIILTVMAFTGLSLAQDIYTCGHYTSSNIQSAIVYKNGSSYGVCSSGSSSIPMSSSDVVVHNGDVYWTANECGSDGNYTRAKIFKNVNTTYMAFDNNEGRHFNSLYSFDNMWLYAGGCQNVNGAKRAMIWRNGGTSPWYTINDGAGSEIFDVVCDKDGNVYACGAIYYANGGSRAKVWKNGTELYSYYSSHDNEARAMTLIGSTVYCLVFEKLGNNQYNALIYTTSYVSSTIVSNATIPSQYYGHCSMCSDASEYYASIITSERSIVWKQGEQFDYFLNDQINNVVVNSTEIYYACNTKIARMYDDEIYYNQPYPSISGMYVEKPECENTDVLSLPYETGFERGHFNDWPGNDWPCWHIFDSDNNNNGVQSYWDMYPDSHDNGSIWDKYCACHRSGNANQDGWLISPRLFLQPGHDTHLTFWTKETGTFANEAVYICTSSTLQLGNFTQIWEQSAANASSSWKQVDIDLSAYGGHAVYIGFRYTGGANAHWWLIDDVSVEEEWDHDQMTAPYSNSFDSANDADWFLYDVDMSGSQKCWQYNTSEHCMYHPYGPTGVPQTGWMMCPIIGYYGNNKTLSFKTKSTSSGTGRKNSVWIQQSNVNNYWSFLPSNFTNGATKVWEDDAYSSSWTNVEIDLSPYLGSSGNIIVAFKYEGTNAHNWFIDDFSITDSGIPCTISVLRDPTEGGTVTGYGTYMMGESCTIGATPNSGWNFINWTRNNNVVSTEPSYTFIVEGNATYTAHFSQTSTQYTITVNANNNAWGTVSGGGQYNAGATCTLHATPASGYQFDSWKKNGSVVSTNPNYSFIVTENATYTAYFSAEPVTYYTITTNVTPTGAGTVTGGGTYPAGSSITLTATANPGYTFSQWQDGSTANPRTITVNGDATYTAQFTQDNYTISVYANPANGGTVTGGGAYHYGETPTLTATANSGFEFQGWDDGVSTNPRQITVTGNATYTAIFSEVGATYYVVTTSVSPAGAGTVTGGGAYEAGTVITLAATANPGYTFSQWNDGSTQNPRTVTVNSNLSFTAIFSQNIYTITVLANPSNAGMVTGGGAYHYGEIVTLTATAYSGYEFQGWSDGSSQNPHQVTVTGNATYTAIFSQSGTTYYTVSTYVSPIGAGTVTGAGTYPAGATATLSATANQGYTFSRWNDGSTSNPRTVTVNNNMSFTAIFTAQQYTITVNSNPSNGGTVTGGGTYAYGSSTTLRAIPNSGFEFMQWQDGSMQNPRVITVTGNATYTALFMQAGGTVYTLTVTPNYQLLGQTFGSGTYPAGSTVEIAAYPSEYAVFVQWNDGNTQNPRTVVVNSNVEYIAEFRAANRYTITVESANPNMGEAYGGGTFFEGAITEISAIPNAGYVFTGWNDGNTQNPRTITVTGDATYTANFSENSVVTHTLTVICNTDQGTVSGGGIYMHGATAVIQAFPNQGYVFTKWSDENTQNPRTITVNSDMSLAAFFATSVGENEEPVLMVYPNPTKESIRILGIEANSSVEIYNSLGELVKVVSASEDQEINVRDLASGLYLLRCGNATLRFIKEK